MRKIKGLKFIFNSNQQDEAILPQQRGLRLNGIGGNSGLNSSSGESSPMPGASQKYNFFSTEEINSALSAANSESARTESAVETEEQITAALENFLDDDELLVKAKEQTDIEVITFFTRDEVIMRLITLITKEYSDDETSIDASVIEKRKYKLPFVTAELLVSPLGKSYILPKILEDSAYWSSNLSSLRGKKSEEQRTPEDPEKKHLLDELFAFLDLPSPPQQLMKLFIKVVITMTKTPSLSDKAMSYYYGNQGRVLQKFITHVSSTDDICELLLLCLLYEKESDTTSDASSDYSDLSTDNELEGGVSSNSEKPTAAKNGGDSSTNGFANNYWTVKESVLATLVSLLVNEEYTENVSAIVSTILTLPRPSLLVEELLKKEKIVPIIENLISKAHISEVFSEGIDFFGTMVIHSQQGDESMQILLGNLSKFVNLLNNPVPLEPISSTFGSIKPLGSYRLKIVEFFVIIFKHLKELSQVHNDIDIYTPLLNSGILQACVKLFFEYEQNNVLHNLVTHIITCVLENEYHDFIEILFTECHLIERMVEAYNKNKQVLKENRVSLGFMGHITIIENFISNLADANERYRNKVLAFKGWNQIAEELKEKHFIECIYRHGGTLPLPSNYVKHYITELDEYEQQKQQPK